MDADLQALYSSSSATVTDKIDCLGVQEQRDWRKWVQSLQSSETATAAALLAEVKRKADAQEALVPLTPLINSLADIASRMGGTQVTIAGVPEIVSALADIASRIGTPSGGTTVVSGPEMTPKQQAWVALYNYHMNARKTSLTTSTTDATLSDIVRDAVLMTNQAFAALEAANP